MNHLITRRSHLEAKQRHLESRQASLEEAGACTYEIYNELRALSQQLTRLNASILQSS